MTDFKYEVGDMFDLLGTEHGYTRRIEARFKSEDGSNRYVVRYFRDGEPRELNGSPDEIHSEAYINDMYTKVEPFFEVGKKYERNGHVSTCVSVHYEKYKYALLVFEDRSMGLRSERDFLNHREVSQ